MKNLKIFFLVLVFLIISFDSYAGSGKRDEEVVINRDTSLIDIPSASVLDRGNFSVKTRFYSGGGVLTNVEVGVLDPLTLGASFMVDNLIGSGDNVKMIKPEMQIKFRFYDGGYYIPALALGYDGQGYFYDRRREEYMQKGKGLYIVGTKEMIFPNLMTHIGFNIPDYNDGYLYSFLGFNYNLEDKINLMMEIDNMFHSDYKSRFNLGVRFNVTSNFNFDIAFRNIGRNSKFINGEPNKMERIVQFNTSFYLGDF
jgi:hypothetical protein